MAQKLIWNFEFCAKKILNLPNPINEANPLKWEIRFFWSQDQIIPLHAPEPSLLNITNYQQKYKEDYYYLLPKCTYNIKLRREALFYKPVLRHSNKAIGYGKKINLTAIDNYPNQKPSTVYKLQRILQKIQETGIKICVKKDSLIYKFETTPRVKLELTRLEVNNKVYFSACIEGKSLHLVETINKHLLDKQVSCDYVTFLKNIIKS